MKKIFLTALCSLALIAACNSSSSGGGGGGDDPTPGPGPEPTPTPTGSITVNFYLDYNQPDAKNVYYSYKVNNGDKLTEPARPSEPIFEEFPVFKGWSHKDIIDNDEDLWNFATDTVDTTDTVFYMYGIWVAQGE